MLHVNKYSLPFNFLSPAPVSAQKWPIDQFVIAPRESYNIDGAPMAIWETFAFRKIEQSKHQSSERRDVASIAALIWRRSALSQPLDASYEALAVTGISLFVTKLQHVYPRFCITQNRRWWRGRKSFYAARSAWMKTGILRSVQSENPISVSSPSDLPTVQANSFVYASQHPKAKPSKRWPRALTWNSGLRMQLQKCQGHPIQEPIRR